MSCHGGGDDAPASTAPSPTGGGKTVSNPTYSANIKSIIDTNCTFSYKPRREKRDVSLETYA